ncbi:MAG: regulatory protein RecX [Lachnospiraceae bacterium]|nr:regulatory protein RecX [Lachnospiraceae bacterium]
MLIESIEPVSKDRSRVKLEGGHEFVLYKGELRILKLKEGADLSDEVYRNIMETVLPKRAKLRALNLLKARAYTEYGLKKKLAEGGYPDSVSDIAIAYVKSYGYINDRQFALDYLSDQSAKRSKKELYQKLSSKGISKEILDGAFAEVYGSYKDAREESSFDETDVIVKTLKKRGFTGNESYEERQKLLAYFYRRGFEMDSVYKAMDSLKE